MYDAPPPDRPPPIPYRRIGLAMLGVLLLIAVVPCCLVILVTFGILR